MVFVLFDLVVLCDCVEVIVVWWLFVFGDVDVLNVWCMMVFVCVVVELLGFDEI